MPDPTLEAPYGYDIYTHTEVIPKPPPPPELGTVLRWRIAVQPKTSEPVPTGSTSQPETAGDLTVQITADQQVALSITGEDRYGNPVDVTGGVVWSSSDEAIVIATPGSDPTTCVAAAVGPVGTAAVTVNNDVDSDGDVDFQGSLAIDVVAGDIAEITIVEGEVTAKP